MDKLVAVGKDMSTYFYLVIATWILGILCRKKVLSELPDRSIVKNGSSCPSTQDNQLANK